MKSSALQKPKPPRTPTPDTAEIAYLVRLKLKFERQYGPLTVDWLKKNGYSERFIKAILGL